MPTGLSKGLQEGGLYMKDSFGGSAAKLLFRCPQKGFYCLYCKSSFIFSGDQPQLWICIMFLFQQSYSANSLSTQDASVQLLKALWEKAQLKGTHSFEMARIQTIHYEKKDDPDDCPIETSKLQSGKSINKKRRDRFLPRAFEIFTDNKTYIFKAKGEKDDEEWFQCNKCCCSAGKRENKLLMRVLISIDGDKIIRMEHDIDFVVMILICNLITVLVTLNHLRV